MIRELQDSDVEQVMRIWLSGNMDAHPFVPGEYWLSNFAAVQEQLTQAEVYVYEADEGVEGFIGLVGDFIAGIFVNGDRRSCGVGRRLLDYAEQGHGALSLDVYQKNERAVAFYIREGFVVSSEQLDEATGEMEYTMAWKK